MQITTTIDLRGALTRLKSLQTSPQDMKKALKVAAVGQVREVKTRTKKGVGLKVLFKPYSQEYSAYRQSKGRSSSSPNLLFSGKMLADMGVVKSTPFESIISFHRKTERDKADGNQRSRPFMGITAAEQKKIVKRFRGSLFK